MELCPARGGPIDWIGLHRIHHLHSDQADDPHDSNQGFFWSHVIWMLHQAPGQAEVPRYTKDIGNDPVYLFFQKYLLLLQIGLGLLALRFRWVAICRLGNFCPPRVRVSLHLVSQQCYPQVWLPYLRVGRSLD